ncbi:hypothetical protein V8E53_013867 [Lactarius tabidus]
MMMADSDVIPDDVWLEIFDFDRLSEPDDHPWEWARLAHVCRKWRRLIFASPRRLKLRILCKSGTPVRENLGIWPDVPILMDYTNYWRGGIKLEDEDNAIAALEHPDRLYRVCLDTNRLPLGSGKIIAMLQRPCPILSCLSITADGRNEPVLPTGLLGGSAPCLQRFELCGIPFPALPTLLLSASDLVDLILSDVPPTGYIFPEAMAEYLATLSRLETLRLEFQIYTPQSAPIPPPPIERTVLPSLWKLSFSGVFNYLEDFVAQIDTPLLSSITICYLDQGIDFEENFELPQLSEFFNRSENLKETLSDKCKIAFIADNYKVDFHIIGGATATDRTGCWYSDEGISVSICCEYVDKQVSRLTNVLGWISPIISDMDVDWLEFLCQFSSVQMMFISEGVAYYISRALEDITKVVDTEVLPALDLLCLDGQPVSSIYGYLAFCRRLGRPVTFVNTPQDFDTIESYT